MKRKIGDRRDAKKIRNLDGMHYILADLKPDRCDADVYINQTFDVTKLVKYLDKKKKEHPDLHITFFHAFSQAIAKLIYNKPLMNRFVANRTYYERNEVKLGFAAKVKFDEKSEELLCVIDVKPNETFMDTQKKISDRVLKIRSNKKSDTNNAISVVGHLPKFIRVLVVGIFKWVDKHGWLPKSFVNDNIYYTSVIMSNLGSINCGSIYHNLTNFGTNSILATIGKVHKEEILLENGKKEIRDVCDFGINIDERIADGVYFAKSLNLLQYIFDNPELLDEKASEKINEKKQ